MNDDSENTALKLPVPGFGKLCFGGDRQVLGERFEQYTFFVKLLGKEPKRSGGRVKVFTVGLFLIRKESRVKAGFVKRRQVLVRA